MWERSTMLFVFVEVDGENNWTETRLCDRRVTKTVTCGWRRSHPVINGSFSFQEFDVKKSILLPVVGVGLSTLLKDLQSSVVGRWGEVVKEKGTHKRYTRGSVDSIFCFTFRLVRSTFLQTNLTQITSLTQTFNYTTKYGSQNLDLPLNFYYVEFGITRVSTSLSPPSSLYRPRTTISREDRRWGLKKLEEVGGGGDGGRGVAAGPWLVTETVLETLESIIL